MKLNLLPLYIHSASTVYFNVEVFHTPLTKQDYTE